MSTDRRFERDLPESLRDLYLGPSPDYRYDVLARTSRMRQRPAWMFPERWLPMAVVDRRRLFAPNVPWRAIGVLALIGLLLAALLGVYAVGQRHVPAPFGLARNGEIVYAKDGDIFARDSAGAPGHVLIGDRETDQAPTFTRQGDRFMFFRVLSDTDNCECEVWVANADGTGVHKLAGPYHNPTTWDWSPDGSRILISHDVAGASVITVIPADGAPPKTLDLGITATNATWRPPNGDQIAFRGVDRLGRPNVFLIKPDGSDLTSLVLPTQNVAPDHDFNHGYSWSPDGRRFAYETLDSLDPAFVGVDAGLRLQIADVDLAGKVTSIHKLLFDPTADNELQPIWLPTGDRIVFQTREGNDDYLSIAPVPAGNATGAGTAKRVGPATATGGGIGFEIAPDGHSLLVLFWNEQKTYRYDLDSGVVTPDDLGPLDVSSYQRLAP